MTSDEHDTAPHVEPSATSRGQHTSRSLSVVSLLLSAVAMLTAGVVYVRAETIAERAVQRREQAIVEHFKPRIHAMYADFDADLPDGAKDPQTLDDLFDPMLRLVSPLQ